MAPLFLVASLALGIVLLRRGWRGSRSGDTPYCRRCGYNLTGLASSECPECGQLLIDGAIVLGERRRRPVSITAGPLCLALAGLLIVAGSRQWLRGFDWYDYKPTFWVVADARSPDLRRASKAYRELLSRMNDGNLSDRQCAWAAEAALTEMTSAARRSILDNVDLLDALRRAGKLTESDQKRFFQSIPLLNLRVRARSLARIGVPVELSRSAQTGSRTGLWLEVATAEGALSPTTPKRYSGYSRTSGGGCGSWFSVVQVPGPGVHDVYYPVRIRVYDGSTMKPDQSVLLYEEERMPSVKATVLAEEPADFIRIVTDANLEAAVRASLQIIELRYDAPKHKSVRAQLKVNNPPVDLAFSIALMRGERQVGSGSLTIDRGRVMQYGTRFDCEVPDLAKVDVVFTPDVDRAKKTVDLTEIWGKPIRFENVPVVGPAAEGK